MNTILHCRIKISNPTDPLTGVISSFTNENHDFQKAFDHSSNLHNKKGYCTSIARLISPVEADHQCVSFCPDHEPSEAEDSS